MAAPPTIPAQSSLPSATAATVVEEDSISNPTEMSGRPLAYVERIVGLEPIEGADRIELAKVRGWTVVVNKAHGHRVGDLVVYFEIDSVLPRWQCFIDDHLDKHCKLI